MEEALPITIWGRANSVSVQKVLWCCAELGLAYQRIDAGMEFGRTRDPEYLALNPNRRIPTLVDDDFVLWESNAILRYLVLEYGRDSALYPTPTRVRTGIERWLDWSLSTLHPVERPFFWALVRTPPAERDHDAIAHDLRRLAGCWSVVDKYLEGNSYLEGGHFSLADLTLGTYARRWFGVEGVERPRFANVENWYARLVERPGFQQHVSGPLA
jgi:glutathione S-transferase